MKKILNFIVPLTLLLCVTTAMAETMVQTETQSDKKSSIHKKVRWAKTYVVLHRHGSVRHSSTEFVDVIRAQSPKAAIKKVLRQFKGKRPGNFKKWVFHKDSQTKNYIRLENPISFVSDTIDNYSARPGHLLHDKKGQLCFVLAFVSRDGLQPEKTEKSLQACAKDAESALKMHMTGRYQDWKVAVYDKYNVRVDKPRQHNDDSPLSEHIDVRVKYILK